jgi:methanogenic corrinoid protein MtbC1
MHDYMGLVSQHFVCMSALLTVTMPAMKSTNQSYRERGTAIPDASASWRNWCRCNLPGIFGADACSENANAAVTQASTLLAETGNGTTQKTARMS